MKVKKIVRLTVLLLFVMMFAIQAIPVSAQTAPLAIDESEASMGYIDIAPFWDNVNNISLSMGYRGDAIGCSGIIRAATGSTSISATFTLARRTVFGTWTTVETWTASSNSSLLTWSGSAPGSRGITYRLSVTATVVRNGVSETVTTSTEGSF